MKTVLLICLLAFCGTAYAQTSADSAANIPDQLKKGTSRVGLGFAYSHSSNASSNSTFSTSQKSDYYVIRGNYGLMVAPKTQVGIQLEFGSNNDVNDGRKTYTGGVYVRRYVPVIKHLVFFGQANSSYGYGKNKTDEATNRKVTSSEFNIGLGGGIAYFANKHWSVDMDINLLNFSHSEFNSSTEDPVSGTATFKTSSTGIVLNPLSGGLYSFGISYYFGGKN